MTPLAGASKTIDGPVALPTIDPLLIVQKYDAPGPASATDAAWPVDPGQTSETVLIVASGAGVTVTATGALAYETQPRESVTITL